MTANNRPPQEWTDVQKACVCEGGGGGGWGVARKDSQGWRRCQWVSDGDEAEGRVRFDGWSSVQIRHIGCYAEEDMAARAYDMTILSY